MAKRGRKPGLRASKKKLEVLISRKLRLERRYRHAINKARESERKLIETSQEVDNQRSHMRNIGYGEF